MKKYVIAAGLCLVAVAAYADTKISQMPSGGSLTTGDVIPILRGGSNFQATYTPSAGAVSSVSGDGVVFNNSLSTGAVNMSLAPQAANLLFSGPSTGGATNPTFRALVRADLPSTVDVMSSMLAATTTNTIDSVGFTQNWNWSSLATNTGLALQGASVTSGKALSATVTGSNTGYAGYFNNPTIGGYAVYAVGTVGITGNAYSVPSSLTISTNTFTPNFGSANHFQIALIHASCPCVVSNPSNPTAGQSGIIEIDQSATGSDTTTWGTSYKFAGGTPPTLSTGSNSKDYFSYYVGDSTHIVISSGVLNAQ